MTTFIVNKELANAAKLAASATGKKSSRLVLEHVLVTVKSYEITFQAVDLVDRGVYFTQSVDMPEKMTDEEITILIHRDVLKSLKAKQECSIYESSVTVNGITYACNIPVEEFPQAPVIESEAFQHTEVESDYFKQLQQVALSASTSEFRPVLQSVHHEGNHIQATDGLRLAKAEFPSSQFQVPFNLPASAAKLLCKAFTTDATVIYNSNYVQYHRNGVCVIVRQIDGQYPDTSRIIPQSSKIMIRVSSVDLLNTLEAALQVLKKNNVTTLDVFTDYIQLRCTNKETGASMDQTISNHVSVSGDTLSISFNAAYLKDAVKQCNSEFVEIGLNAPNQPFTIKPYDATKTVLTLVSPVA